MQGVGTLLRLLRADRDGLFELHIIAFRETIPLCRAAAETTNVLPIICEIVDLLYVCLPGDAMPLLLTKRLNRHLTVRGRAREVSSGSPCGKALYPAGWRLDTSLHSTQKPLRKCVNTNVLIYNILCDLIMK